MSPLPPSVVTVGSHDTLLRRCDIRQDFLDLDYSEEEELFKSSMKVAEPQRTHCTQKDNVALLTYPSIQELSPDINLPRDGECSGYVPEYIQRLIEGSNVCGDSYSKFSKPDWFDSEKFRRGQKFAVDHIFGVMFCELMSLMMLFCYTHSRVPLIFTKQSDSPFKAFKRYLSTVIRVKTWYEGDIWDPKNSAHKNLKSVRRMHDATRIKMSKFQESELKDEIKLQDTDVHFPTATKQMNDLLEDFQINCPHLCCPLTSSEPVYISQSDMALTQFGFAGLLLLFPKMFGIHKASKLELESFAHFWRVIGFTLGIEDRYNLCGGDLETVLARCSDVLRHWIRPVFRTVNSDWLHLSRCVFDGMNYFLPCSTFEVILLYLCDVLEVKMPKLRQSLSFSQHLIYSYTVLLYKYLMQLPFLVYLHNLLLNFSLLVYKIVSFCKS